ncbi:MAG: LysR family transcriptional regulator [Pseudomonadota bacterium]
MAFNPHQFKAFAHVVREGSLSAAAKALGVSQSAITQHIANLETVVGARLFLRARDGVELTSTGQEFYELADRYASLDALIGEKLQGYAELARGHLRIIANAPQPALRLIARYAHIHQDVNIDFSLFDWSTAMEMLQKQQIDIAIVTDPTERANWHRMPIELSRYVLYAHSSHRLAHRSQVSLRDVMSETLLLPESGSLTQRIVTSALRRYDLHPRRIVRTTTFPVMKEAILEGLGVGIFLEDSARNEQLISAVPIRELSTYHETCLVVPRHRMDLRLIQSFVRVAGDA